MNIISQEQFETLVPPSVNPATENQEVPPPPPTIIEETTTTSPPDNVSPLLADFFTFWGFKINSSYTLLLESELQEGHLALITWVDI